jgi:hypothetical protein
MNIYIFAAEEKHFDDKKRISPNKIFAENAKNPKVKSKQYIANRSKSKGLLLSVFSVEKLTNSAERVPKDIEGSKLCPALYVACLWLECRLA